MTRAEAAAILGRVCRHELSLEFTRHFWERVDERFPGLRQLHVYLALRTGAVDGLPVWSREYDNHVVTVVSVVPDIGRIRLVVAISSSAGAVCITIYTAR